MTCAACKDLVSMTGHGTVSVQDSSSSRSEAGNTQCKATAYHFEILERQKVDAVY